MRHGHGDEQPHGIPLLATQCNARTDDRRADDGRTGGGRDGCTADLNAGRRIKGRCFTWHHACTGVALTLPRNVRALSIIGTQCARLPSTARVTACGILVSAVVVISTLVCGGMPSINRLLWFNAIRPGPTDIGRGVVHVELAAAAEIPAAMARSMESKVRGQRW